jgi:hypothetical protein
MLRRFTEKIHSSPNALSYWVSTLKPHFGWKSLVA